MGKLMKAPPDLDDQMYCAESDIDYEYPRRPSEDEEEMKEEISQLRYNQFGIVDQRKLKEVIMQRSLEK